MSVNRENSKILQCHKAVCTIKSADDPVELTIISLRDRLELALENESVKKALHAIRQAEHNHDKKKDKDDSELYWIYNGKKRLDDQEDHPANKQGAQQRSTPAGAYQIVVGTWNIAKKKLNLADFCQYNQDLAALFIINGEGKLTNIENGKFLDESTLKKLSVQWAALPMGPGKLSHYPDQNDSCMEYDILKIHYEHY